MLPYKVEAYSENALKGFLVEGSHKANDDVRSKSHSNYLHGYLQEIGAATIVAEYNYVDRDFLEDFAAYHVRCFENYRRTCLRLHFFRPSFTDVHFEDAILRKTSADFLEDGYLGFVVVKPLPNTVVGRTCLTNYPLHPSTHERSFPTLRTEQANVFGLKLHLQSLPFQEQDQDVAACASSSLWTALNGTSRLFQHSTPSPVEITRAAGLHFRLENRHFPAGGGLTSNQMADAIRSVGLEPHAIAVDKPHVLKIATLAYARAGIPCLLLGDLYKQRAAGALTLLGGHAIAVAGYGMPAGSSGAALPQGCRFAALSVDRLYCHDDQTGPFASLRFEPDGLARILPPTTDKLVLVPKVFIAPLYHKVRISVLAVIDMAQQVDEALEVVRLAGAGILPLSERLTWDISLAMVNSVRTEVAASQVDEAHKLHLLTRDYPRFMWRLQASDAGTPVFTALLDATDLMQGQQLVEVIPHDRSVCRGVAASASAVVAVFAHLRRVCHFFQWFSDNAQFL